MAKDLDIFLKDMQMAMEHTKTGINPDVHSQVTGQTMECYQALQRHDPVTHSTTWMSLRIIMLSGRRQTKKKKVHTV